MKQTKKEPRSYRQCIGGWGGIGELVLFLFPQIEKKLKRTNPIAPILIGIGERLENWGVPLVCLRNNEDMNLYGGKENGEKRYKGCG